MKPNGLDSPIGSQKEIQTLPHVKWYHDEFKASGTIAMGCFVFQDNQGKKKTTT